jgi:hypothetical protein
MKVSGFSFIKNAIKFDYPILESIQSILPLVDEYVIAIGDSEDETKKLIESIDNTKIKIINTVWDKNLRNKGEVLAVETNKALAAVGKDADWLFYLQGDECIHEKDYTTIKKSMLEWKENKNVDGLLFKYLHFYGNYHYIGTGKRWYRNEIRIIKNNRTITSWKDAQGFRFKNGEKLKVKKVDASVYHYGWVKPPKISTQKSILFNTINSHDYIASQDEIQKDFDYHNIDKLSLFKENHPAVMQHRINNVSWQFDFDTKKINFKKMKLKHRISHYIEDITGYRIGEYKNYKLI